jgi:hypothetical protein
MNWETVEASLQSPQHTALSIYLFLFGELTDAWLSSTMIHLDRIQLAWMCIIGMNQSMKNPTPSCQLIKMVSLIKVTRSFISGGTFLLVYVSNIKNFTPLFHSFYGSTVLDA